MSSLPPSINSSTPGNPAGYNVNANGQKILNTKSPYPNYDIQNMYLEQSGKQNIPIGRIARFNLKCNGYSFQAHIDPKNLTDIQGKRLVELDVLTGIVFQDFGYVAEGITLRGTTGARYYTKLKEMDAVFKNQSTVGVPTPATLTIENRTYTGVWKNFEFTRTAYEQVYEYTIEFRVMYSGNNTTNNNTSSQVISQNKVIISTSTANGTNQVKYVDWSGKTPLDYVRAVTSIPNSQRSAALAYLNQNWSTAPQNSARSYPGDNAVLNSGEVLVVSNPWSNVLSSVNSNGPILSGNLTSVA